MPNCEGRTALVTGGSRGIGRAICLALADAGADVAVNYVSSADAAEEVAAEVRARGRRAETYQADVADYAACQAMTAAALNDFGTVDILINNAGIGSSAINRPTIEEAKIEEPKSGDAK